MLLDAAVTLWILVAANLLFCSSRACTPVCRVFSTCKADVPAQRDRK